MLEVNNLTKKYGKTVANDDLSFVVGAGEIGVLAGPNGAGKSTTIKSVAGLLRYRGDIRICGEQNKSATAKRLLGYVPELPALYNLLTVEEHLQFIGRAYKLEGDWEDRAAALMERLELTEHRRKLGKELSKGMQQKVSLACALLPEPKVLLLDEPMVGLDPHAIKELKTIMSELRAQGCAMLISTHMLDSVENLWDSVLIMMRGHIERAISRADAEGMEESLEDLFFRITESRRPSETAQEDSPWPL